jgi:hypothetical protein
MSTTTETTPTPELIELLAKQGIAFDAFCTNRTLAALALNRQQAHPFAKSSD